MKKIGIIGGLGPLAMVKLMEIFSEKNINNIDFVIINNPKTPDRTAYILDNNKENPVNSILEMVKKLELGKVDVIVMPCNTASYFYKEIEKNTNIPFINIVFETVKYLKENNIKKVGLLATEGTIKSKIYENLLNENNIELVIPNYKNQKIISSIIYDDVKSGKKVDLNKFYKVVSNLESQGCEKIILGCTELSALRKIENLTDLVLVDAMEVLADKAIEFIKK